MHLNPNVWLPYLRIVATLSKEVSDCIYIDSRMFDLVQSFSHLSHLITSDSDDSEDITIRKYSFIGQVNKTLRYFGELFSFVYYPLLLNTIYFMQTVVVSLIWM